MNTQNVTPLKEGEAVKLRPEWENRINIPTLLAIISLSMALAGTGIGLVRYIVALEHKVDNHIVRDTEKEAAALVSQNEKWAQHLEVHQNASNQRTGEISRLNTQIEALNTENLPYRIRSLEAQYQNAEKNMTDIKTQMNALASDQRLTNQKLDQLISIMSGNSPFPAQRNQ